MGGGGVGVCGGIGPIEGVSRLEGVDVKPVRLIAAVNTLVVAGALGVGCVLGWRLVHADARARVFEARLRELSEEHRRLGERYNRAVRRTAVTELLVEDGALSVRVRGLDGVLETIPTPFDPRGEVYIDYVVREGRLLVRRVFDEHTPPAEALVIDPGLTTVGWSGAWGPSPGRPAHGKAVYRSLEDGRWVVTVTGDGSLGLSRAGEGGPLGWGESELAAGASVEWFEESAVSSPEVEPSLADVWRAVVGE